MSVINRHNNYEVANFGKPVPSDSDKMSKVEISEDARDYIIDRDGAVTVEIRTSFG